jgi:hypothetical protein
MKIENNVIVSFDPADKHLTISKNVVGMDYFISDMMSEAVESIAVEEGNKHFYVQDGCLIWRDKKALMLAVKGAKIPDDGSVTSIAGGRVYVSRYSQRDGNSCLYQRNSLQCFCKYGA